MSIEAPPTAPATDSSVERATLEIGRRIFRRLKKHEKGLLRPGVLDDAMMQLMMRDEDLRYRMLRFVDVFPALRTAESVASHLEEYLTSPDLATGIPPTGLSTMARTIGRQRAATRAPIKWASRLGIERMGRKFIAGATPEEVAVRVREMERDGFTFSLDLLGEFVVSESQANEYQRRYREMIERFGSLIGGATAAKNGGVGPRVNISIKLSSLTTKFDPMDAEGTSADVRRRLRPLLRSAMKRGVFLNIDMEKYEFRDLTQEIILDLLSEEEFRGYKHLGTVHQAYLVDAEQSLRWFIGELRRRGLEMTIRLVKGAYWDSEQIWARVRGWPVPVYTDKRETDACYERCTRILLESHDVVATAIASHNVRSIAHALALKRRLKVPDARFELQMLYGMAGPIKDALRDMGVPVRIYTPCGELIPGMAYLVRRILENTSNESFLRLRFAEGAAEDKLLANPKTVSLPIYERTNR